MNLDLSTKAALVTGSSRGIGRAIARELASAGARVALHYNNNLSKAEETRSQLEGDGHILIQGNMTRPMDLVRMVDRTIEKFGKIDVLVNNAGIYEEVDFLRMTYDAWQQAWKRTMETNLTGVANLSFLVANHMVEKGSGRVINISSRGAFRGEPTAFAYGASKAGLNALGQSMAKALAPHNVFVFTVAPGWVDTDMATDGLIGARGEEIKAQSPLNRVAQPEEIARLVAFLASEGHDYMTGCIVDINGASYLRT
ncbi:MAG: SDR family oxidoreductase [Lentimicrobiaceae bacterium]|nr:SDR family oxidoreductase [Lentimicrobiaceae bacterium]